MLLKGHDAPLDNSLVLGIGFVITLASIPVSVALSAQQPVWTVLQFVGGAILLQTLAIVAVLLVAVAIVVVALGLGRLLGRW